MVVLYCVEEHIESFLRILRATDWSNSKRLEVGFGPDY